MDFQAKHHGFLSRSAAALLLVASSAYGMTALDRDELIFRDLTDAYTAASVRRINTKIQRSIASIRPAQEKKISEQVARRVRPEWSMQSCLVENENSSYFSQFGPSHEEGLNEQVFDANTSRVLRSEYEGMVAQAEARDNAGLSDSYEKKSHFQAMKDFARRAVNVISKLHVKTEGNRLKEAAQNQNGLREPMAAAVLAASLYTGKAMNFKIAEGVRLQPRAALKHKAASVSMLVPGAGLSSTFAYSRNEAFNAQIAKSITPAISAVAGTSATQKGSAQLVYSVSF